MSSYKKRGYMSKGERNHLNRREIVDAVFAPISRGVPHGTIVHS